MVEKLSIIQAIISITPHSNLVRYIRQHGNAIKSINELIKYLIQSRLSFKKLKIEKIMFILRAPFKKVSITNMEYKKIKIGLYIQAR
nr:MAG TPA: hypothetical protein [Caudoviricetes sp.]